MFTPILLVLICLIAFAACIPKELSDATIINERYVVIEKIESGGQATVYKVNDKSTRTIRAMKIKETLPDEIALKVEHDFYLSLQCNDPLLKPSGLPWVGEYNTYESCEFFILEFFCECLVDKYLSEPQYLGVIVQVISILQHIHSKQVIHRDIKADNLMLRDKQVVLVDFGLAQQYASESESIGKRVGTRSTASVRALERKNQDQSCDLQSLGFASMIMLNISMPYSPVYIDPTDNKLDVDLKKKSAFLKEGIKQPYFRNGRMSGIFAPYFEELGTLSFGQTPNYDKLRELFNNKLAEIRGHKFEPPQSRNRI